MSYAVAEVSLSALEEQLASTLAGDNPLHGFAPTLLLDAARHTCLQRKAKRIRPQLAFLCGTLMEAPREHLLSVATAGELFHTASLLHDDIIDEATERRGAPTACAKWNRTVAVLSGDLMFSLGLICLREAPARVTIAAAQAIALTAQGAVAEAEVRGNCDVSIALWRHIAELKTGALFAFCGLSAGDLVGDTDAAGRLRAFGLRVGVAFQIADDLVDLVGDNKGRKPFSDIRNRDVAIPILLGVRSSRAFASMLKQLWSNSDCRESEIQAVADALLATGAIETGMNYIHEEIEEAIASLGSFSGYSEGRKLADWARSIEIRTHQYLQANGFRS